jgi:ribonuclease HI
MLNQLLMAEAHAMKDGLALAATIGCNNIIAESDSTDVIQACNGADCVDMAVSVGSVTFSHIARDANQVVHTLARESFIHNLSCTWVDEPPSFLLDKLLNDVTII